MILKTIHVWILEYGETIGLDAEITKPVGYISLKT